MFVFATSFRLLNTVTEEKNGDIDIDHELMPLDRLLHGLPFSTSQYL
jgi:hypothetical protein